MEGFITAIVIVVVVIVLVVTFMLFNKQTKAITVVKDENDKQIYAIFQTGDDFTVKNLKNNDFEPVKFKKWNDVITYIERERANWE